ncbi:MAG: response regulator [Proteobacteria bacterium]|nr:response regulator [Pseudomonadota bacterium]
MGKKLILIADDEIDNVILLQKRLRASGFDTVEAYDGNETIEKVFQCNPDLILLDIMMPGKDGYEVLQILRTNEKTKDIPVIMLTARAEIPDKVKGLELGAEDYVTKPFDYNELLARINSHLESKREVEEKIKLEKLAALSTMMEGVAHEVRNPLVVIGGFTKKLLSMTPDDDPRRLYLEMIQKEAERLDKMIKDIYEFKIITLNINEKVSINKCLEEIIANYTDICKENKINIVLELAKQDISIDMDKKLFMRAIKNIINNSIEAMPNGGELKISTEISDNKFYIYIKDTGIGIEEEDLKYIFDPFFTSKMEGTGLGLTQALKIIQGHKGTLTITSKKNFGTTAIISFNLS